MMFPERDSGSGVEVVTFGEAGGPPSSPGPFVRVPTGTVLSRICNTLADTRAGTSLTGGDHVYRRISGLMLLLFLSHVHAGSAEAQTALDSANVVVRDFLLAMSEQRWQDAAELIHPETRAEFQRRQLEALQCAPDLRPPSIDDYLRMDPAMPREVAAYLFRRDSVLLPAMDSIRRLSNRFPGIESVAEMERLTPLDFVRLHLENENALRLRHGMPGVYRADIVGGVREGDWINVLYRHAYERFEQDPTGAIGFFRPPPKLIRLRRSAVGWRIGSVGVIRTQTVTGDLGPGVLPRMGESPCNVPGRSAMD